MSAPQPSGGFSLFPNTNASQPKPTQSLPPRKTTPRPRAATPSSPKRSIDAGSAELQFPPRNDRSTPQSHPPSPPRHRRHPSSDVESHAASVRSTNNRSPQEGPREDLLHQEFVASGPVIPLASNNPWRPRTPPESHPVQQPHAPGDVPARTETAFSEAPTLVRSQSTRSRSSIAKRPIVEPEDDGPESPLRSIFPQYNHAIPLDRQEYFPTQRSPTHIPHGIISRQPYSPTGMDGGRSPPPLRSPEHQRSASAEASSSAAVAGPSNTHQNQYHQHSHSEPAFQPPRRRVFTEPEPDPPISRTDELRGLWKVCNGWKASASEGRPYALRVTTERDAPVFTLCSAAGQPFYNLRIEPSSASAHVTVARHDPSKPYKTPKVPKSSGSLISPLSPRSPASSTASGSGGASASSPISAPVVNTSMKPWTEVLTTTLEEPDRRLPPNDGLVALLYPLQAARMALEKPDDELVVAVAEREAARLVYDHDSDSTFLVHPALATPFRVTIERHAALSRTEYLLEHVESPHPLARLVRDFTGGGFLEVDTAVAARVDAVYVCDVAVTALLLVASEDEKGRKIELFEPPPPPAALIKEDRRSSSRISMASRASKKVEKKAAAALGTRRFESFEVDLESQSGSTGKQVGLDDKDKIPRSVRIILKILTALLKCFIWVLSIGFKTLAALIEGLSRCCVGKK